MIHGNDMNHTAFPLQYLCIGFYYLPVVGQNGIEPSPFRRVIVVALNESINPISRTPIQSFPD